VLESFTFYIAFTQGRILFDALVYAWDADAFATTGPALFSSFDNELDTPTGSLGTKEPVTIVTGGVALMPGESYIAFFRNTSGPVGAAVSRGFNPDGTSYPLGRGFAARSDDFPIPGGGGTPGPIEGRPWFGSESTSNDYDYKFRFVFSGGPTPIPLPATGWLLLAGLGALGLMHRRRVV
jgi:hypothetical protein